MSLSLSTLPSELYSVILRHVPKEILSITVRNLVVAIPSAQIPQVYLFRYVYLRHANQIFPLYQRLRRAPLEAEWVSELLIQTWTPDADLVVNLMRLLKCLKRLSVCIGVTYAPEHLEVGWP
jgi:hypothetical protein